MDDDIRKEVDNLRTLIEKQETSLSRFTTERSTGSTSWASRGP
jgi:hypothetical protein